MNDIWGPSSWRWLKDMARTTQSIVSSESLSSIVFFDVLSEKFGADVERAVNAALKASAVFPGGGDALAVFQNTLAASIRDIEGDERGRLFQRKRPAKHIYTFCNG